MRPRRAPAELLVFAARGALHGELLGEDGPVGSHLLPVQEAGPYPSELRCCRIVVLQPAADAQGGWGASAPLKQIITLKLL